MNRLKLRDIWEMFKYLFLYEIRWFVCKRRCEKVYKLAKVGYISKQQATVAVNRIVFLFNKNSKYFKERDNENT